MTLKSKKRSQAIVLYVDGDQAFAYSYRKRGRGAKLRAEGHSRLGQAINLIEPARLVDDLGGVFRQLSSTTKDCIVVLPSHLAPSVILKVPDIDPEDQRGFIQIQAEQQLPLPLSEVHLATYEFQIGKQDHALVVGLRRDTVSKLKEAVIANGFQVASITVDIAGVVDHAVDGNDSLADSCQLIQGQSSLTMVTHAEGGPTGLRHFHLANGGMDAATLERELRITLGQFPQSSRRQLTTLRTAKLPGASSEQPVPISEHRSLAGLNVVDGTETSDLFVPIASSFFLKGTSPLEFLPSISSRFDKIYGQFNSRRNLWVGLMSVVALTAIAFLYQIFRLDDLQKDWNRMKDRVAVVEAAQGKIREFRPWFDSSVPSLTTARAITRAFPETGEIWLKQLNIRNDSKDMKNVSKVMANGSSSDQSTLLDTQDKLRITSGISNFKGKSLQGSDPISFSFEFDWNPAGVSTSTQ
ncbi:MAG: hypothetical protein QGI20_00020 [Verrucomicrobiota bacterium]|mgnify:FL=1|jgi:hypothetical protein|nr:hypothetical protein [Verrucomicrobiota bacterium]